MTESRETFDNSANESLATWAGYVSERGSSEEPALMLTFFIASCQTSIRILGALTRAAILILEYLDEPLLSDTNVSYLHLAALRRNLWIIPQLLLKLGEQLRAESPSTVGAASHECPFYRHKKVHEA
jgi:hypothetical protein